MRIQPESQSRRYLEWLRNIRPWCISRQLWWGHQIPVWYREDEETYVGLEPPEGAGWERDPDVLDTWFSSALWPFATLGWPEETARAARLLPDRRALDRARHPLPVGRADGDDGPRVHRRRPLRRRLRALGHPGARRAADEQVAGHRHRPARRDRRARRRRGALRAAGDVEHPGRALLLREGPPGPGAGQQALQRRALRAAATSSPRPSPRPRPTTIQDRWILSRLQEAKAQFDANLAAFDFAKAALGLYDFVYGELCDWYLEFNKGREYDRRPLGHDAPRPARDAAARAPGHPVRDRGAVVARARRRGPAGQPSGPPGPTTACATPTPRRAWAPSSPRSPRCAPGATTRGVKPGQVLPARLDGLDGDAELGGADGAPGPRGRRRDDRRRARSRAAWSRSAPGALVDPAEEERKRAAERERLRGEIARAEAQAGQRGLRGQGARAARRRRAREARPPAPGARGSCDPRRRPSATCSASSCSACASAWTGCAG